MKSRRQPTVTLVSLFLIASTTSVTDGHEWQWTQQAEESVALQRGDTVIWQFNYGADEPKPYFHPVALPDGPVVTWNRPPDHVWHHGLWFCWKFINGVNYWEPDRGTGKPAGRTTWSGVQITTTPGGTARIQLDLDYRPADGPSVMTERRVVEVSAPTEDGSYFFDWVCRFTAGPQDVELNRTPLPTEPGGQAWGGYAGLSVRLAAELTDRAADSAAGPVPFNDQSRYRGRALALDYHGLINGRAVGVAICDHPHNLHHPTPWYVIRSDTMSYFSPAVICYGPHTLPDGQDMTLQYRVWVHPGRWNADRLGREFSDYVR